MMRALCARAPIPIDPLSGTFWLCVVCVSQMSPSRPLTVLLPPPSSALCALTHSLALPSVRAQSPPRTRSPRAPPSPVIASFTPSTHWFGAGRGAGWDINLRVEATSYTQTGPARSAKTTSKKTPKPGVLVPTLCSGAERESRRRDVSSAGAPDQRPVCLAAAAAAAQSW